MSAENCQGLRVAVVDDDDNLRRSFERLLRAAGMRAVSYASAEAFIEADDRAGFDCMVLDMQLLGMSGLALQRHVLQRGDAPPIVFITAFDDPQARTQAVAAGCAGYFGKDDLGGDVLAAIRRVSTRPPAAA